MYPILTRLPYAFLYSYTVVLSLGILVGLVLVARHFGKRNDFVWLDGTLLSLAGAFIGGRAGFVLINWAYYQERPSEVWQLWQGGLSFYGALVGGVLVLWLWGRWQRRPFARYAHLFAPAVAVVNSFGWAACYLEGCAYGAETVIGPLAADLPDTFGVFALRYQTQLIGFLLSLPLVGLSLWLQRRWMDGRPFWATILGIALIQFLLTFLRGDVIPQLAGIRLDTILAGLVAIIAFLLLQYRFLSAK